MSAKAKVLIFTLCAFIALPTLAAAQTQTPIFKGQDEFVWNCADCHGLDGRGRGPLAKALIKVPSDLTQIAKENLGVFPADKIFDIIAGKKSVNGHQSFQMPNYWDRFKQTEGQRGYDSAEVRIKAIVDYLEKIQAP